MRRIMKGIAEGNRSENEVIFWHLDGNYLGFTQTFHEMEIRPQPGVRTLTLVDSAGSVINRRFTVIDSSAEFSAR